MTVDRRDFLRAVAATGLATLAPLPTFAAEEKKSSETVVKLLFASLTDKQKKEIAFDWDYKDPKRGLLRAHISNNWRITPPAIQSDYYTGDQQKMIRDIFVGLINPDWVERFDKQFKDDMGGFAKQQSIALFGKPDGKFEFVLSGRHGTIRCDGNSADHVAFAGPIVYGHAASGYFEKHNHPNNVFWHQAEAANKVYQMLDGKQRKLALLPEAPDEAEIGFRGTKEKIPGIPFSELSKDQREHVQKVLQLLVEPYRQSDREEALAALKKQGGLDKCSLIFYKADDLGEDEIWDNWRLEGPAFVWHYRGAPHVHVWVNVADDPNVAYNGKNLSGPLREKDK